MLDRASRAQNSSVQQLIREYTHGRYLVDTWAVNEYVVDAAATLRPRRGVRGIQEYDVHERWSLRPLPTEPRTPADIVVDSIYYARSALVLGRRGLRESVFVVNKGMGWREVGLCVLHAAGWRPDCSVGEEINSVRMPPPLFKRSAPIVVGALNDCTWIGLKEQQRIEEQIVDAGNTLQVEVDVRRLESVFVLISYMRDPAGEVCMQGVFLGECQGDGVPVFFREAAIAHALELVLIYLQKPGGTAEEARRRTKRIAVSASDGVTCGRVHTWLSRGDWLLQSAAAPQVAVLCGRLAPVLCCPMVLYSHLREKKAELPPVEHPDDGSTMLEGMWGRAQILWGAVLRQRWSARMSRVPLTSGELHEKVRIRYESDELMLVGRMGRQVSVTCALYTRLGLTRDVIRRALAELSECRMQQVVLCSILCCTRFKYFEGRLLYPTVCQKCGGEDSFDHLTECVGLRPATPTEDPDPTVAFLAELARRAHAIHSGLPVPTREVTEGDLVLSMGDPTDDEGSGGDAADMELTESGAESRVAGE